MAADAPFADGARVFVGGDVAFELVPRAGCFGGTSYDEDDVSIAILRHLGGPLAFSTERGGHRAAIIAMGHSMGEE